MNHDRWVSAGIAAALAYLISLGAVGSLITAFSLPVNDGALVLLGCLLPALLGAGAFSVKGGGFLILGLGTLGIFWLRRQGQTVDCFLALVSRISAVYDSAYGWGVLTFPGELPQTFHQILIPLGAAIALVTAWTVCWKMPCFPVLLLGAGTLVPCVVVTNTVPEPRFLYALFLGLILLLLTGQVRRSSAYQANRLTLLGVLPTALALGLLFLAIPQDSYVNRSQELREALAAWFQGPSSGISISDTTISSLPREPDRLELSALGSRAPSDQPVLWVTTETGGTVYLRGQDYDRYNGTSWESSPHRVEPFSYEGTSMGLVTVQTASALDRLYLPYYPQGGHRLVGGRLENSQLSSAYTFPRLGLGSNWRDLAQTPLEGPYPQELEPYLTLPEETRREAQAFLDTLPGADTVAARAEAIGALVKDAAVYDLNAPTMAQESRDFAIWFLREGERGYCVHFATAAVVLLRASGIPARYVSGYLAATYAGQTAAVTGAQAHAWAEYYEPSLNTWLILEATPGTPGPEEAPVPRESVQETAAPEITETFPAVPETTQPQASVPGTQPPVQEDPAQSPSRGRNLAPLLGILGLLAAAGAVELQRSLRLALRRRRRNRGGPNRQALARWRETLFLARLQGSPPPEELEALALKAKFSQHTLSPEEIAQFDRYLRRSRRALGRRSWYRKLLYRYWYAID